MNNHLKRKIHDFIHVKTILTVIAVIFVCSMSEAKIKPSIKLAVKGKAISTQTIRMVSPLLDTIPVIEVEEANDLPCNPSNAEIDATFGAATVVGGCGSGLVATGVVDPPVLINGCDYSVTKNWTVTDSCGNVATASQTMYFSTNTLPPAPSMVPSDYSAPLNTLFDDLVFANVTFTDNCGGTGTITDINTTHSTGTACDSIFTRTWTAYSFCGTIAVVTQSITVSYDNIVPVITVTDAAVVGCNPTNAEIDAAFGSASVTDNCSTGLVASGTVGSEGGTACNRSVTKTWTVTDAAGNIATATQTVNFTRDTEVPVITLAAAGSVSCNPTNADIEAAFGTASVSDNCSNNLTAAGTIDPEVGTGCTRSVTKNWTVTDGCGNIGTASQTITFTRDTEKPVITCSADKSLACNQPVLFDTPSATDNCDASPAITVESTNTVGTVITRTWKVSDACGNVDYCSQSITITGSQMTMGTCSHTDVDCHLSRGGSSGSVTAGTISNSFGTVSYTWTNANGDVVGTTATVNNLPAGVYTLTVTDNCSSLTCSQTVVEPLLMTMANCSHTNITCGATEPNGSVTAGAISNPAGAVNYIWKNSSNVTVGTSATVTGLPEGQYTLIVFDGCTTLSCTQTISQPSGLRMGACTHIDALCNSIYNTGSVSAGNITNATGPVTYKWTNAQNDIVGTTPSVRNLPVGTYTLTVKDNCTTLTCSQTIGTHSYLAMTPCSHTNVTSISRFTNPTGSNGRVTAGRVYNASGPVSYSWVNESNVVIGTTPSVNGLPVGTYTLTVTDNCSSVTCSQTIILATPGASEGENFSTPPVATNTTSAISFQDGVVAIELAERKLAIRTDAVSNDITAYPNPFTDMVVITTNEQQAGKMKVSLYGESGIIVRNFELNVQKGISKQTLTGLGNLPVGAYVIKIVTNDKVTTYRVIKR